MLGDGPARLLLEEDKREKNPCIWALVIHSSRENRRSLFSPFAFLISCETCRVSSFLPYCSPMSNLEMRYYLTFSEKRTAPPLGLWSAYSSLTFDWKGSLPCLSIALVLSSSERVRNENFSTQPRLSLSYTLSVCCPTAMCSSMSSTDLNVLAHAGSGHSNTCPNSQLLSASPLSCVLPRVTQNSPVLFWDRQRLDA